MYVFPRIWILAMLILLSCKQNIRPDQTPLLPIEYVNPFIGTGFHGHTFPGATLPHGRVQLSPDTHIMGWDASSGYHYDDTTLYGFSHTHLSGTGIGDMGDFLFLPYAANHIIEQPVAILNHNQEMASPGYYRVVVNPWNIIAELSVTTRTGKHHYTYPNHQQAHLFVNLNHVLQPNWGHQLVSGDLQHLNDSTLAGFRVTSGWAAIDSIWFYCQFNQRIEQIEFSQNNQSAHLNFGILNEPLEYSVGISSVDAEGAKLNFYEYSDLDFENTRQHAKQVWEQSLDAIEIKSDDSSVLTNFYTALYHSQIAPFLISDVDGKYRDLDQKIYKSKERHYTAYSLWDTFRAWFPLMTIIRSDQCRIWIEDLYQNYQKGGLLPKWPLNSNYTGTMVGYPAVGVIADAVTKELVTNHLDQFLTASISSASWQPGFVDKHRGTRAQQVMNEAIYYKEKYGIIPVDSANGSVSYGLEMAYYDWCISQIAEKAGQDTIAQTFKEKSNYYMKYFDSEVQFMHGVHMDGTFHKPFNPNYSDHERSEFIEGNAWQWTPTVFHDVAGFANLMGGPTGLGEWLDRLFTTSSEVEGENASADITGLIGQYAHGNEPSHHIPYLYYFTDRPWKVQEVLDTILYHFYQPTSDGIIGNEDCGQMSAWYVLNAIGLYQVTPGKPVYHLGRPIVDQATIKVNNQQVFTITVKNNSRQNKYIQTADINGAPIADNQITHQQIMSGGELLLVMGPKPKNQ